MSKLELKRTVDQNSAENVYQPEEQLQALFRSCSNYMVYRLRKEPNHPLLAVVEVVSPSINELMGVENPQDLSTWFARVHPEDRGRLWESQKRCFHENVPFDEILRIERPSGEVRHIHVTSHPVPDASGKVTHYNGLVVDVTERMKLIREAEELRQRLDMAKQWEAVGTLGASVAHDLNNLLQAVLGCTLTLAPTLSPNQLTDHQVEIERLIEQGVKLTQSLSKNARYDERKKASFDLWELLERVAGTICKMYVNLQVSVQKPESPCTFVGYETLLERALLNLALNAAHATGEVGEVTLKVRQLSPEEATKLVPTTAEESRFLISVSDNGCGIPEDIQTRIFDEFFTTKSADKGTGLGLVSVRRAATLHGGKVWVESSPGQGSTFSMLIPASSVPALGKRPEKKERRQNPTGSVLVVEDEPTLRILLAKMLTDQGFEVASTADSSEALRSLDAAKGQFQAMVTDLFVPGTNGLDFVRQTRRMYPSLPILVTSGDMGMNVQIEIAQLPRCGFLAKPFNPGQLQQELKSLLG